MSDREKEAQQMLELLHNVLENDQRDICSGRKIYVGLCQQTKCFADKIRQEMPDAAIWSASMKGWLKEESHDCMEKFDYILAGAALEEAEEPEHLTEIFLSRLREQGKLLCCFGNIRHWSVWQELAAGHWRYGEECVGVLRQNVRHFFAMNEIRRMFMRAGYKNLQVQRVLRPGEPQFIEALHSLGAVDTQQDLNTEFYLLAACKANPDEAERKELPYSHEVQQELAYLLRRIEHAIDRQENVHRLWILCAARHIDADDLLEFIHRSVLQPEKVLHCLAEEECHDGR